MKLFSLCLMGYFFGSIPFGMILGRLRGVDLRKQGSGNIGAANAARSLGLIFGLLVLVGDLLKGVAALAVSGGLLEGERLSLQLSGVGMCVILGHNYSCWLGFRGGKGVASTFGVFLFLSWKAALSAFSFWTLVVALTRFASLGSLTAAFLLPVFMKVFKEPQPYFFFSIAAFLLILYQHRKNVVRLVQGKEPSLTFRLGKKEQA